MPSLDKLASVDIGLAGSAFTEASYSTILVGYAAKLSSDVTPQLVGSADEFAQVTSVDTSSAAYIGVQVLFQQSRRPSRIIVMPFQSDTSGAIADGTAFTNALQTNASKLNALGGYYGVLFPSSDNSNKQLVADFCETVRKLYVTVDLTGNSLSATDGTDLAGYIKAKAYNYTAVLATSTQLNGSESAAFAWMAQNFFYAAGTENWAETQLTGVLPTYLTDTQRTLVLSKNANTYEPYGEEEGNAVSLTYKGTVGSGHYIDEIRGRDWLCNAIKVAVVNTIVQRPRLPYTAGGMAVVKNAVLGVLEKAMTIGFLAPPTVASDGVTTIPSYTVTMPARVDVANSDIQLRQLNGLTFTAVLAGAIDRIGDDDTVGISGTLVYGYEE